MTPLPPPLSFTLAAASEPIELTLRSLPAWAALDRAWRDAAPGAARERLWQQRALRKRLGDGPTATNTVWCWRIGEALLVAQPNEMYSWAQLELRRQFAPRPVAVLNLSNGCSSYLPPRGHYEGDYYSVNISPFAAGSLESMVEGAGRLGRKLIQA